ncbi:MAG TPA: hypothetical protein QGH10_24645, partial [Armatimonadota bacterium]|nr:hypothetical protein [Armatimonadota bacterium]
MVKLIPWEKGFAVEPGEDASNRMYFWFYEWNCFEAVHPGEHTGGRSDFTWETSDSHAEMEARGFRVEASAKEDGAELELTIANQSTHEWPAPAAIIPCFAPGFDGMPGQNTRFLDKGHERTYFAGAEQLELLHAREIHFNDQLRSQVDARTETGEFVWQEKWPTSPRNAAAGVLIRESDDGEWVAGIGWQDFLSAQGHNPWNCMHVSICVGPL